MTPYAALVERIRSDPASPLLTYRDLRTGERMELSAASLGNAIAKTAGLLRDELDAEPGMVVGIHLPFHWQRVVWLGACAATGTVFAPDASPEGCDVCVMDRDHLDLRGLAAEDVLVSLAPFGLPDPGGAPAGVTDAAVAMRTHPDTFTPWEPPDAAAPLIRREGATLTQGDVMDEARATLANRGVSDGQRFALISPDSESDILSLAGPLILGSGVVLVAHPDSGDLAATLREEGVEGDER